jgi:ABC-2 type transport system ATP-binding protein
MPAHNVPALVLRRLTKSFGRPAVDRLELKSPPANSTRCSARTAPERQRRCAWSRGFCRLTTATSRSSESTPAARRSRPREIVAWLPDEPMLYDKLDPLEYLEFVAGLWSVEARRAKRLAEDLLESLGLWPHRRDRCEGFSRGMRQKLALAGALIHEPRLLMLDEPLTGLDAAAARQVKDILTERVRAGATIIMTTHILEVAERLADRIGIIARGKMIAEGTLDELRASVNADGATLETVFLDLTSQAGRGA